MKYRFIFIPIFFFLLSCNEKATSIYMGQYFKKGQRFILNIDDGEFIYEKRFDTTYISGSKELLKRYTSKNDTIKIYLQIDENDTITFLPSSTSKILLGNDVEGNIFLYTDKDDEVWFLD